MTDQYPRSFSLQVGPSGGTGLAFVSGDLSAGAPEFRVQFQVHRGDTQTPNSCDVRVFNLKTSTANQLVVPEFTQIVLQAGYPGNLGLIFQGSIKQVRRGRIDQKDSYVDITAADGDEAYNFSFLATSLAAGQVTPANWAETLIKTMAKAAAANNQAVQAGYQPQYPTNALPRAKVAFGSVREYLRDFNETYDTTTFIDNGFINIVPRTAFIPGGETPLISVGTGLIGVPEWQQSGLHIRTLLNPQIKIGQLIKLEAAAINQYRYGLDRASISTNQLLTNNKLINTDTDGLYYVMTVDHNGDSRGQEWYSDLTCLSVSALYPPADAPGVLVFPDTVFIGGPRN